MISYTLLNGIFKIGDKCVVLHNGAGGILNIVAHGMPRPQLFGLADGMEDSKICISKDGNGTVLYEMRNFKNGSYGYSLCGVISEPHEDERDTICLRNVEIDTVLGYKMPIPIRMSRWLYADDVFTFVSRHKDDEYAKNQLMLWKPCMGFDSARSSFIHKLNDDDDTLVASVKVGERELYVDMQGTFYENDDRNNYFGEIIPGKRPRLNDDEQKNLREACEKKLTGFLGKGIKRFGIREV